MAHHRPHAMHLLTGILDMGAGPEKRPRAGVKQRTSSRARESGRRADCLGPWSTSRTAKGRTREGAAGPAEMAVEEGKYQMHVQMSKGMTLANR